jgi:hypothetical protein
LKLASTPSWLSVSAILLFSCFAAFAQNQAPRRNPGERPIRNYEWKLAGLLPGHTTLKRAEQLLGEPLSQEPGSESAAWHDCDGSDLTVEADAKGIIQTVRVSQPVVKGPILDCFGQAEVRASHWKISLGLRLGDSSSRVIQLYGNPDSRSPFTKGGQPLQLLYYAFDWAGPDVPQVMQVVCTAEQDGETGRVVEITLAASSL